MATNFLEYAGGSNGFLVAPTNIISSELNSLGNGSTATSSVAGPFSQTTWSSGIILTGYFTAGAIMTATVGGVLAGWWLRSTDGGTTFESLVATASTTVAALPRPPDFVIPVYEGGVALVTSSIKWAQSEFVYPWVSAKALIQNLSGVTLPATGNTIKVGSVAIQY